MEADEACPFDQVMPSNAREAKFETFEHKIRKFGDTKLTKNNGEVGDGVPGYQTHTGQESNTGQHIR